MDITCRHAQTRQLLLHVKTLFLESNTALSIAAAQEMLDGCVRASLTSSGQDQMSAVEKTQAKRAREPARFA